MLRYLLPAMLLLGYSQAKAQCYFPYLPYIGARHYEAAEPDTARFKPTRFGLTFSGAAFVSRQALLAGGQLEGTYRVAPRWQAGLLASYAVPTRIGPSLGETGAAKPMLGLFSALGRVGFLLSDNAQTRTMLLLGAGLGGATLSDRSQQISNDKGGSCGCAEEVGTHAKVLRTALGGAVLGGVASSHKLRDDMWLTAQLQRQQWVGPSRFGTAADLSAWVFSLGLTMPDRWGK